MKEIDYRKVRAMDVKSNQRVNMPRKLDNQTEKEMTLRDTMTTRIIH